MQQPEVLHSRSGQMLEGRVREKISNTGNEPLASIDEPEQAAMMTEKIRKNFIFDFLVVF